MAVMARMVRFAAASHVWLYRTSKGRIGGRVRGLPILLLTVPGRRTGAAHTTPVSYIRDGDAYVVSGSAGGQPLEPQWFRNLRAAENCVIEVGGARKQVTVRVASPSERETLWANLIGVAPFFAKYQQKVQREIPIAILTPGSS